MRVSRIVVLNAMQDFPYSAYFTSMFPEIELLTMRGLVSSPRDNVCFDTAVLVGFPNLVYGRQWIDPHSMEEFSSYVYERAGVYENRSKPSVVFLSRKNRINGGGRKSRRFVQNEELLAAAIRTKLGWSAQTICMEDLTFKEQVKLMSSTTVLISIHQAGLFNAMFMRPGGIVLQIHVPGTHFGTMEYEERPQEPLWLHGMWHLNLERLCDQRGLTYLEGWATPDPAHAQVFKGRWRTLSKVQLAKEYLSWAGHDGSGVLRRWSQCASGDRSMDLCHEDISNEMRAHSVADALEFPEEQMWNLLLPHKDVLSPAMVKPTGSSRNLVGQSH